MPGISGSTRAAKTAKRLAALAVLMALLGAVLSPAPAGAAGQPANLTRSGPNLTLVLANCERSADTTTVLELARHSRNAAAACLGADGVPAELAALIANYAPDRVMVVGGPAAVPPAVMDELTAAVRSAYRWAVIQRLGGATRAETAAEAARIGLDTPERAGTGAITLIVADGWNDADVNTAREFAAGFEDVAIAYFSPSTIADGLPEATASLIADYRPARIVFAGLADEAGSAAEAAVAGVLASIESTVSVERVALATATPSPAPGTAALTSDAHETFRAISAGERTRPTSAVGETQPFLALTMASGIPGVGSTLFTLRADGSGRVLRTADHHGWEWHPSDGRLAWSDNDEQVMAAAPDGQGELLAEQGVWPLWSPDGSRLIVFDTEDVDGDGWFDRAEVTLSGADGTQPRSLGFVDLRTWYYADISGGMWSPDGMHVAYVTGDIHPETAEIVQQVRIEPADAGSPPVTLADDGIILRWSPDSSHLLYATPQVCGEETGDIWDLWVAAADGSGARRIDTISFPEWSVLIINAWAPDSAHVAYEAVDPQDCSTELRVSAITPDDGGEDGVPAESVTIAADASFLGWSPDSAYVEYGAKTDIPVADYLLPEQSWIAKRDGSSKRYIGELYPSLYGWLFWSQDGEHISYTEMLRDDDGNVMGTVARAERADGEGRITTLAPSGNSLSWSSDGRVAYVAQHDDDGDGAPDRQALYLHTPGSRDADVELVHTLPAWTGAAIWSPDDSHLIYASGAIESLISWYRDRGRGANGWTVATDQPRWMHRLVADVTWGEWQPQPEAEAE